jgi:SAM-dependent methyltransferase
MMAGVSGIYDEPELYQLTCAYRDVPAESGALLTWLDKHATITDGVRSVIELAAGPAEHARELAQSAAMCGYAAAQAKAAAVDLDVVEADMRDFRIADADGRPARFDLAITMLNSVCHLFTLDDLVNHLAAVAAHLAPGGLYIVELAHPADFFAAEPRTSSDWTVESDGVHAQVRWGGREDRIDPLTQVTAEHMMIKVTAADGTVRTVSDVVPNRFWTLTEFTAAVRLANARAAAPVRPLDLVASYGDFDDTTALDAPAAWRMILVLRSA